MSAMKELAERIMGEASQLAHVAVRIGTGDLESLDLKISQMRMYLDGIEAMYLASEGKA
ncbi:hypothetical protein [Saccharothrix sp. HUAS TT1]|uniref:hypothetical protein n=1 Tax=unclassified Saccharothrix TaxID=2593673 RepID=UPI00345BC3AB